MVNNKFLFNLYFWLPKKTRGIFLSMVTRLEKGEMYSGTLRAIFKKQYGVTVGYGSYGGCFNPRNIQPGVEFGNYCSISSNIRIYRANHPKDRFTTHPLLYNPIAGLVDRDMLDRAPLSIGNDVWIGEWSIILPGVKNIGDGAIIGAGSIVTKDVQPYTIVAGNPAKQISKRFNNSSIEKNLSGTKWWEMSKHDLIKIIKNLDSITSA